MPALQKGHDLSCPYKGRTTSDAASNSGLDGGFKIRMRTMKGKRRERQDERPFGFACLRQAGLRVNKRGQLA